MLIRDVFTNAHALANVNVRKPFFKPVEVTIGLRRQQKTRRQYIKNFCEIVLFYQTLNFTVDLVRRVSCRGVIVHYSGCRISPIFQSFNWYSLLRVPD